MRPLTEDDIRASFVNAGPDELRLVALPADFILTDWDHLDFFAWRDPRTVRRRPPGGGRPAEDTRRAGRGK